MSNATVGLLSIFKSSLKLGANQVFVQSCSFLRNVIVARLVSPEDFGIAATFALTFQFLEMVSNLAAETLMVQADYGDDPKFQSAAHMLQAGRGLTNSILIFVLAAPLSRLFGVPQAKWAFQCIALVPFVKGLAHTDLFRVQRQVKFGPAISVDLGTNVAATVAACLLGLWLRSYSLMVWVLVVQACCATAGSHLVAERSYRWTWNRAYIDRICRFGWPLLINGLLMYLIFQGDRFVIGISHRIFSKAAYSLADLGVYSIAFSMTLMPTMLVANVCTSIFLPVLSHVQTVRPQFERRYLACAQVVSLVAVAMSVPFILAGGWLVVAIYGRNYAAAAGFIGWLAAMQALRIIRVAPTLAAMALGDTKNAMVSNLVRAVAFSGVLGVAAAGGSLEWMAACGFVGEVLALAVCLLRLRREHELALSLCLEPFAIPAIAMALAAVALAVGVPDHGRWIAFLSSAFLILAASSVMVVASPGLRRDLRVLVALPGLHQV